MNKLLNVFRMSLFVSLLIIFLAVTFGIYMPMKNELTKELNEKFSNNAKLSKKAIENFLKRCIEGAESLSSRTMIRKMIVEYLSGNITFEELQEYTAPKYLDGANVLQNLKRATRIVSGNIIASVGDSNMEKAISCEDVSETTLDIEFENQSIVVNVCSPIRENTNHNFVFMTSSRGRNGENVTVIGHDLVSFDMTKLLDEINTGNIVYEIYIATNSKYISLKGKIFDVLKDDTLSSDGKTTRYIMKLRDTDAFLVASVPNNIIYTRIKKISLTIFIVIAAAFLIVVLLIHFTILTNAKKMIKTMEQDNIKLKELERLKSEFLATMSHELRTPLNSIIGFVSMILQGISGDINEEQRKQLSMVHSSSVHLLNLINDILDISKIEAGRIEFF
ncbi:histidine kinase dimerization/phospho-acceptor domain-containing protein [Kosmotoga sp. DU53]|uniref:sensor histidine kinase n=1 Tax=Kosmotoga sp. DU53 TaxID=1310160 RepID=UPI0007C4BB6A|nr:histidine kinase dimerization/phospho-acceptor domain-containing protein [Kosmotoga sp. DU53]